MSGRQGNEETGKGKGQGLVLKPGGECPPLLGREQKNQTGKRSSLLCLGVTDSEDDDRPFGSLHDAYGLMLCEILEVL